MTSAPIDKVQIIERSLRCFRHGMGGLFPLLGLPFAVYAILAARKLRRAAEGQWNPAERYLKWAIFFSWLGILLSLLVAIPIGLYLYQQFSGTEP